MVRFAMVKQSVPLGIPITKNVRVILSCVLIVQALRKFDRFVRLKYRLVFASLKIQTDVRLRVVLTELARRKRMNVLQNDP